MPRPGSRGLVAVLGFAFAVEGALYSAVTPILPMLSRHLAMSEPEAGLMLSSYSAGLVAGSLICVPVLRRFDVRTIAASTLLVLAFSTAIFASTSDYEFALASRLVQGIAGGATWTACVTWLLRLFPIEKRGEAIGMAAGPAVVGTIAGPAIGTIGVEIGIRGPYTAVALMCVASAAWLLRMPRPVLRRDVSGNPPRPTRRPRRLLLLGAALVVADGAIIGLINLEGPLVLVSTGASERTAGVVFAAAAVGTVFAARLLGIWVDRRGAIRAAAAGMAVMTLTLPLLGVGWGTWLTAAAVVLALLANNLSYIASGTLLSREGERAGWTDSFVMAVAATVWGIGETVGALLAGVGLEVAGDLSTASAGAVLAATLMTASLLLPRVDSVGQDTTSQAVPAHDGELKT